MKSNLEYKFNRKDVGDVIKFCRDYHLEITKQSSGRTGSGPRGFGGEIDEFGPGKLAEIAVAKLLSIAGKKKCTIDNQIYSNSKVGETTIPDIVRVIEKKFSSRLPNLYIEIKTLPESSQWLGIRSDQLDSILRTSNINLDQIFLVFAEVYFQDNKNRKQRDFLGAFLKSLSIQYPVSFQNFSNLKDLRCKIRYIVSIKDLRKFGHEFKTGDIVPEIDFANKKIFNKDGKLAKGYTLFKSSPRTNSLQAVSLDGNIYSYGKFKIKGQIQVIKKNGSEKTYLKMLTNTLIENDYFGSFHFNKGEIINFNIKNKLKGQRGGEVKKISDWWIYRKKLDNLILDQKISPINESITKIQKNI